MKWSYLIVYLFCSAHCISQTSKEATLWDVFIYAIQLKVIKDEFKLCKTEGRQINVFDFENQLPDFPITQEMCSKKIKVFNTTCTDHPTPDSIVIYKIEKKKKKIKMYFWQPYSGAAVILSFSVTDSGIQLVDTKIGSF